jgi:hypothetical protein
MEGGGKRQRLTESDRQMATHEEAGSSSAVGNPAQIDEPPVHRFLHFQSAYHKEIYKNLRHRPVLPIKGINWEVISQIEDFDPLVALLPPGSPWRNFFDIMEPSYDELVYEFWSTFEYRKYSKRSVPSVSFYLCGKEHKDMPLTEFAQHLRIYSAAEVDSPFFMSSITTSPPDMEEYWKIIAPKGTGGRNKNDQTMRDPLRCFMHRVISWTIRGRGFHPQRVSNKDLVYLYSIFEHYPYNIAHGLADYFAHYSAKPAKNLMGGSYITRLAKTLGILTPNIIRELSPPKNPGFVDHIPALSYPDGTPRLLQLPQAEVPLVFPEMQQLQQHMPEFQHDLQIQQQQLPPLPEQLGQYTLPPLPEQLGQYTLPPLPEEFHPATINLQQTQDSFAILESQIPGFMEQEQQQWQQFSPEEMNYLQGVIGQESPQQQLLQQFPQEQPQPAFTGASTSSMPPMSAPQSSIEASLARIEDRLQRIENNYQGLVQEIRSLHQSFANLTAELAPHRASSSRPPHWP